jgi:hypothetical protein
MGEVRDLSSLREFFEAARELVMADFMDFECRWLPSEATVRFQWHRCFAYEGVTALGVADACECGIYDRVYGWLDALGIGYEVSPATAHCTMHTDGTCIRTVRLHFGSPG